MLTKLLEKIMPDSKFTKFWQNKQKRALVLLPIWLLFIALVIKFYIIPIKNGPKYQENNTTVNENQKGNDIWQTLLSNNYHFNFIITFLDGHQELYVGDSFYNKAKVLITKNEETKEFFIENKMIYIKNDDVYTYYANVNLEDYKEFLCVKNIYDYFKNSEAIVNNNEYYYEKEGNNVTIITESEYVISINLNYAGLTYLLKFTDINKIEGIS